MPIPPNRKGADHEVTKKQTTEDEIQLADVVEESEVVKRFKAERLKWDDDTDVGYWLCITFQSEAQKLEFLADPRFKDLQVLYRTYVDGEAFAEKVGAVITPNDIPAKKDPFNKKLASMVDVTKIRNPVKSKAPRKKQG